MARRNRRRKKTTPGNALPQIKAVPKAGTDDRDLSALMGHGSASLPFNVGWTDSRIEQVRHFKHWVYIAIDRIATKLSHHLPNISYVRSAAKPVNNSKALTPLLSHEHLEQVPPNHPLVRLIHDPNEPDTWGTLCYETTLFLGLTGSAYWWIPKNALGLPTAIWCVPSHWVWPLMGKKKLIDGYEIRPVEGNYLRKVIPSEDIVHFCRKSPISKVDAYSPTTAGSQWIDTQESVDRAQWWSYKNGTFPTVAIQFDGKTHDPTEEMLRRIEAKFISRYASEIRSNKPIFLPPGVSIKPLVIKPNEMVFGTTQKETRDNILALYGVPAIVAGIMEGLTYGSIGAAQVGFCTFVINPWYRFYGDILTEKLARLYDDSLRIWWNDTTPNDPDVLERQIQTDMMSGAITPNEIRIMRGREPYPDWGNDPIFPTNMGTLPLGGKNNPVPLPPTVPGPSINEEQFRSLQQEIVRQAQQPIINVTSPPINIASPPAPVVNVAVNIPPQRRTYKSVTRDDNGLIVAVTEQEVLEDTPHAPGLDEARSDNDVGPLDKSGNTEKLGSSSI